MIHGHYTAGVIKQDEGVVVTFSAMLTIFTTRNNCGKVGSNIDVVLCSQATETGADIGVVKTILITWSGAICYWRYVLKKRSRIGLV